MRFTIRDLLWSIAVAGLATTIFVQRNELAVARGSAALNARRIEAATGLLNEYGYRVLWADDDSYHGPCNIYPHPQRVGDPVHDQDDYPKSN